MGKKKNKIAKLTEEQYYAYIAGLKEDAALFSADGKMIVPSPFKSDEQ
ncbi:MAG: hypothetical protein K2O89_01680 [Clostridia bacterium]|nr:hypothetical protein [Clostridia bacterium]